MIQLLWCILISAICNFSFGQGYLEVKGKVLDRRSQALLPYAHVGISRSSIGTVSNEAGEFRIVIPADHYLDTLTISYLGYHTLRSPISGLPPSTIFYLDEAPIVLSEVVIRERHLSSEEILLRAVKNLLQNISYPKNDFMLQGFYREDQQVNGVTIFSVESAFNVYDVQCTQPLTGIEINEFRKMVYPGQALRSKMYNHNNLLRLFDTSTNFVVLSKRGLNAGRTTWAIGRRPYKILDVSVYNGREVYIIIHENPFVSLKIIVDANNFAVLRNEYHTKQAPGNLANYFWKYREGEFRCGFYESHQVYEYREFNGKMYPYLFYRSDFAKCFDKNGKVESESSGSYQALISQIVLNRKRPEKLKVLKKYEGMQEIDFKYNEEFWSHYNIIMDLPRE